MFGKKDIKQKTDNDSKELKSGVATLIKQQEEPKPLLLPFRTIISNLRKKQVEDKRPLKFNVSCETCWYSANQGDYCDLHKAIIYPDPKIMAKHCDDYITDTQHTAKHE